MILKYTKILVLFSILASCISFINTKIGFQEFYPFTFWKLYTQPLGNDYIYTDQRLYGITKNKDTIRIKNKGYPTFNQDDYYYFLIDEVKKIKNNQEIPHIKKRIYAFGKNIAPEYEKYLVVTETYNPIEIIKDSTKITKKIILITDENH